MEDVKKELQNVLSEALDTEPEDIFLEHPADMVHGDYASNAALANAQASGRNPRELAETAVRFIEEKKPKMVASAEVAGPGFINFHLAPEFFSEAISEIREKGDAWGRNELRNNEKTIVEYTDPNPFKEMHIGHLMSNAIGESISRLIQFSGAEVKRANYQGDVGIHVACAIWGLMQDMPREITSEALGNAYAKGATAYKKDEKAKTEIDTLNKTIYEGSDAEVNAVWEKGRDVSLNHFEEIYKMLGTKFNFYFFESEVSDLGKQLVKEHIGEVFEESDGAIVFHGEKYNEKLHTRVFLNKDDLPTYEAKELGLAVEKYNRYPYERSVVITANEIEEYFKVLKEALKQIKPELAEKTEHIPHGLLKLPGGKMSSRTGDVITGESLLADMERAAFEAMQEPDEEIAQQIAIAAIKYAILKQNTGRNITFDPEQSLSLEGDSGPYLQYSSTRAKSVLEKAEALDIQPSTERGSDDVTELERLIYRFPEVTERAVREYEPHYIATFLTELAGAFNSYYHQYRIADGDNAPYRVALTQAFKQTMENGLWLLGIPVPERM